MRIDQIIQPQVLESFDFLSQLAHENADGLWDLASPGVSPHIPTVTLQSGSPAKAGLEWAKNAIRAAGDTGKAVWKALEDPEVRTQIDRFCAVALLAGFHIPAFQDIDMVFLLPLLMFVASYIHTGGEE